MKAVILAAGIGKRLGDLTKSLPKPMIRIFDKPILEYIINDLVKSGFDEICIVIGHYGEQIKQYFGNGERFDSRITYVTQMDYNGTADATLYAKDFVGNEMFLLHLGDAINPDALEKYSGDMFNDKTDASIISVKIEDSMKMNVGNIEVDGNNVIKISEKSQTSESNLAWAGVVIFKNIGIFEEIKKMTISPTGEYEITDAINMMILDKKIIRNYICETSIDVGTE